ncbi:hypothetical protein B1H38_09715 [Leptospira borgpetersenii serovar Ballum]|nr:hypothetical protein B1H38_09715 [Leptospira borgpetersenii serovar Ballum]
MISNVTLSFILDRLCVGDIGFMLFKATFRITSLSEQKLQKYLLTLFHGIGDELLKVADDKARTCDSR